MPGHYTDEQKANRKKGGQVVQQEQHDKYRERLRRQQLKKEMESLRTQKVNQE